MAKITRAHKVCDQQLHVLQERVAELEAKLAALDWTPITESNLPKVGDEIAAFTGMTADIRIARVEYSWGALTEFGWTHFRPINAPKEIK